MKKEKKKTKKTKKKTRRMIKKAKTIAKTAKNESVYNHNVFSLFLAIFGGFAEMPTDLWTCGHTHGQTVRNGSI